MSEKVDGIVSNLATSLSSLNEVDYTEAEIRIMSSFLEDLLHSSSSISSSVIPVTSTVASDVSCMSE